MPLKRLDWISFLRLPDRQILEIMIRSSSNIDSFSGSQTELMGSGGVRITVYERRSGEKVPIKNPAPGRVFSSAKTMRY
jgi:hypothetical protein